MSIFSSRAAAELAVLKQCEQAVFHRNLPADTFLAELFHTEKRYGSSDRRRIRNGVFAFFRWRGLAEKAFGTPEVSPQSMMLTLAAENLLGANPEGYAELFQRNAADLCAASETDSSLLRAENAAKLYGIHVHFEPEDVLPAWVRNDCASGFAMQFQSKTPVWLRSEEPDLGKRLLKYGIRAERSPLLETAWKCEPFKGNLYTLAEYREGLFEVQDFSSQCIGAAANAKPGESWWDVCAGAGGKTMQLIAQLKGSGSVTASDISSARLQPLAERAARGKGFAGLRTFVHDASGPVPPDFAGKFDGVLIDAPCSATGRWRRNPEARWICTPETVRRCAEIQSQILEKAAESVRPGGVLVYGTCSFLPEENEKQVQKFLLLHSDFELDEKSCILLNNNHNGMLRVNPCDADCDASFAARLHRKKDSPVVRMPQTMV